METHLYEGTAVATVRTDHNTKHSLFAANPVLSALIELVWCLHH